MAAADPFAADAAAFDTAAPEPTTFQRGEYSIAEKTGAATYAYPFVVPPGRGGMQPSLALRYSSQAPLRGGVAAGWSLPLPSIQVDTSGGTGGQRRFMATLDGAVGRLVETPDVASHGGVTYRTEHDDSFTIFERSTVTPFADNTTVTAAAVGDVDGDGDDELFIAFKGADSKAYIYRSDDGQGIGQLIYQSGGTESTITAMAAGDTNGDGSDELFTTFQNSITKASYIYRSDTGQNVGGRIFGSSTLTLTAMAAGDVDGDGNDELFTAFKHSSTQVSYIYRSETGRSVSDGGLVYRAGSNAWTIKALAAGDTDRDGNDELFSAFQYSTGGSRIYRSDTGRSIGSRIYRASSNAWTITALAAGDTDGDGNGELFSAFQYSTGESRIYRSDTGASIGGRIYTAGSNAWTIKALAAGDIDRDGDDELFSAFQYSTGESRIYRSDTGREIGARISRDWVVEPMAHVNAVIATQWLARTTDGITHRFGLSSRPEDTRWMLEQQVDRFGNTVAYAWDRLTLANNGVDFTLDTIQYTANPAAGLAAHARVDFEYAPLEIIPGTHTPVGAAVSYATGQLHYEGAKRLTAIVTRVRDEPEAPWRDVRRVSLDYDLEALGYEIGDINRPLTGRTDASPMRYLRSISTTAYNRDGVATSTPPVTFTYGEDARPFRVEKTMLVALPPKYGFFEANSTLMEINGDGILDRVEIRLAESQSPTPAGHCELAWRQGLHGGGFGSLEYVMPLPTVAWNNGPHASRQDGEGCMLSGQKLGGHGEQMFRFADMDGDGDMDLLTQLYQKESRLEPPNQQNSPQLAEIVWPGNQPASMPFVIPPISGTGITTGGSQEPMLSIPKPSNTGTQITTGGSPGPMFLAANQNGDSESKQECAQNEENQASSNASGCKVELFEDKWSWEDFCRIVYDCDGFSPSEELPDGPKPPKQEVLAQREFGDNGAHVWRMYRNTGTRFQPLSSSVPQSCNDDQWWLYGGTGTSAAFYCTANFELKPGDDRSGALFGTYNLADSDGDGVTEIVSPFAGKLITRKENETAKVLEDINGDGLPDIVEGYDYVKDGIVVARFNSAAGWVNEQTRVIDGFSYVTRASVSSSAAQRNKESAVYHVDVDGDGLLDLLELGKRVYFNVGGEFLPTPHELDHGPYHYAKGHTVGADVRIDDQIIRAWVQTADFVDANGDGLKDLVSWEQVRTGGPWLQTIYSQNVDGAPPRRLVQVDNGLGGTIEFSYSPVTNPAVVSRDLIEENNLPHVFWVVDANRVDDVQGPASTTNYTYSDPMYHSHTGRTGDPKRFLGFGVVTKTLPGGARVVEQYNYGLANDARGRLWKQTTYNVTEDGSYQPVTQVDTHWLNRPLFDGEVTFSYAYKTVTRTFDASGSVPLDNIHQRYDTFLPWQNDEGQDAMYQLRGTVAYTGLYPDDSSRTLTSYYTRYTPELYHVAAGHISEWEAVPGTNGSKYRILSDRYIRLDSQQLPFKTLTKIDDQTWATELKEFDPQTGNVIAITKPAQVAHNPEQKTTFDYDPFRIYVTQTTNELGHQVLHTYDLGTGDLLVERGPNFKQIGDAVVWNTQQWRRDGLGRVTERLVSVDHPVEGYELIPVERFGYTDEANGRRVSQQHRLDFEDDIWSTPTETFYDGRGRLRSKLEPTEHGDAITQYRYDEGGNLETIIAPLPGSTDPSETVEYSYERDSLGRVTRFRRPDETGLAIHYDGLTETRTEVTQGGSGGSKVADYDSFGRLVRLEEHGADEPAVWEYAYDGLDRVASILDADGTLTELAYDQAGRRRSIARGDRVWQYDYDLNGNLVAETTPVPQAADPADYTNRIEYDALDRVVSRLPAARGMDPDRMQHLGIGETIFHYDGSQRAEDNAIGSLSRVELRPFGEVLYAYDAQGLVAREERSFRVDYLATAAATQSIETQYNPLGMPTVVRLDDGTTWQTAYDNRGLVDSVQWFDPQAQQHRSVADYTRSPSGHVIRRDSDFDQQRIVRYDQLGRPIGDEIFAGGTPLADRSYGYSDSGDLLSLTGQTSGVAANARFTYDSLHRLVAAQGPNGYEGAFTYSAAGNVLTARVDWHGSPHARNVAYVYGATDPQAVDALVDQATGEVWASFEYNLAGATTRRQTLEGLWTFEYDGDDQMREADGPQGHEAYYYDHNGQRMLAVNENQVRFTFGPGETRFSSAGEQVLRYAHIGGAGGTLARVETVGGNTPEIELQYADSLQNLMLSLDAHGQPTAAFLYGPFGEVVYSEGQHNHNRHFNGKQDDAAAGLRYYGFRYYDPITLRWTSADPKYLFTPDAALTDPRRINLYAFSGNNAVRYYDPDGLDMGLAAWTQNHDISELWEAKPVSLKETVDFITDGFAVVAGFLIGGGVANAPVNRTDAQGNKYQEETYPSRTLADEAWGAVATFGGPVLGKLGRSAVRLLANGATAASRAAIADTVPALAIADTAPAASSAIFGSALVRTNHWIKEQIIDRGGSVSGKVLSEILDEAERLFGHIHLD